MASFIAMLVVLKTVTPGAIAGGVYGVLCRNNNAKLILGAKIGAMGVATGATLMFWPSSRGEPGSPDVNHVYRILFGVGTISFFGSAMTGMASTIVIRKALQAFIKIK